MILFVNGASSAGKTSLARALQSAWESPLLYWSLDAVIAQLPLRYTGTGSDAADGFPLEEADEGYIINVGRSGLALNELSARYLATLADSGFDVVADFVLLSRHMLAPYEQALSTHAVCLIGLSCDEQTLATRNAARADRATGLSLNQQRRVHFCADRYNLHLDSSKVEADQLAASVMEHIKVTPPTPGLG